MARDRPRQPANRNC